jgi:hypothetical protein
MSTLNTLAALTAVSSPPTMTKPTASHFSEAKRISLQSRCGNSRLLQYFLLILFIVDCEKPKDFTTSLVLLPLINNTTMFTSLFLKIGFIMPILTLQLH